MNPQSMGIGGGAIFTLYNATTGKVTVINARETVPQNVRRNLLSDCHPHRSLQPGVQWIAVPGELRGYELAHRLHGKLPWRSLFEPSITLARQGFPVPRYLSMILKQLFLRFPYIRNTSVCSVLCKDGEPVKEGETLRLPVLADTLTTIAQLGADAFYQGPIAKKLVNDIQAAGGNLTAEDLKSYHKAHQMEPLNISLGEYQLFSPPPPSGGVVVSLILNILKGYGFSPDSLSESEKVQTYHRVIEALKFGNGQQFSLQDSAFHNMSKVTRLLTDGFAAEQRARITDQSQPPQYYSLSDSRPDTYGTAHIAVMDINGNGVSVTSSINHLFGSMFVSETTGVILNNQLADFCLDRGEPMQPGEQPPSAMTPVVLTTGDGHSVLLVGASGGSMIISAVTQVVMNKLWFGLDMKQAIEAKRFHVKSSNEVQFEEQFDKTVIRKLEERKHKVVKPELLLPIVQGIFRNQGCIQAVSDSRKMGDSDGY
ncbi:glutathione hydrolase 5 proenzyme isoform X3 [Callorhinchus milii]|nr:glutathione hydrolase 5 proenzyme isoform X3 [Callorhinchus milii]AFK11609.1 gamma-glutamyltransferase 5-like protein [Callorhinchus milii]|eukprot:gi/632955862/ref/XP_007893673.1/ PREDICTED: gamma-glutamyltransferase 5-like isoform X2 [Callorhinchus milii]